MNIKNIFYKHKENGTSLTIIIILTLLFFGLQIAFPIPHLTRATLLPYIFNTLLIIPMAALVIFLERKGGTFAAHLIFFAYFLSDFIFELFKTNTAYTTALYKVQLILGVFASIYVLMKIYFHKDEINKYVPAASRSVVLLIIIALLDVYFSSKFNSTMTYLIMFAAILTTMKTKESLLLVIAVFITEVIRNMSVLLLAFESKSVFDLIIIFISLLINIYFTYYAIKLYSYNDIEHDTSSTYYYN